MGIVAKGLVARKLKSTSVTFPVLESIYMHIPNLYP